MVNINEIKIGEAKEIAALFGNLGGNMTISDENFSPYQIGQNYIIRTVTFIYTGKIVKVMQSELVLEEAAWVADTGRWADCLKKPEVLKEVEPYPAGQVIIGRGAIVDASIWKHELPKTQK